ncbi:hypothetical protein ACFCX0_28935 [Streptomyces sp. NPDC056352]|uniref:hypothetical protein n=1 Tax=Streptomyces sp. NPDC056352 TaxID=3345791 RepID=UPI0035D78DBF
MTAGAVPRGRRSAPRSGTVLVALPARDLLVRAHIHLGGPIVVVWVNLNTHRTAGMKKYAAEHDWLTVFQRPD